MNHILIALDFSEASPEVEKTGFALAAKINASVSLVAVINKYIDYVPADTGQVFADQWEARKDLAQKSLDKIKNAHPETETEVICFIGDPKEDIIKLSLEKPTTFIVMGTHGRTGFSQLLMGSTAEYIVRHSVVPIVVVPMKNKPH